MQNRKLQLLKKSEVINNKERFGDWEIDMYLKSLFLIIIQMNILLIFSTK